MSLVKKSDQSSDPQISNILRAFDNQLTRLLLDINKMKKAKLEYFLRDKTSRDSRAVKKKSQEDSGNSVVFDIKISESRPLSGLIQEADLSQIPKLNDALAGISNIYHADFGALYEAASKEFDEKSRSVPEETEIIIANQDIDGAKEVLVFEKSFPFLYHQEKSVSTVTNSTMGVPPFLPPAAPSSAPSDGTISTPDHALNNISEEIRSSHKEPLQYRNPKAKSSEDPDFIVQTSNLINTATQKIPDIDPARTESTNSIDTEEQAQSAQFSQTKAEASLLEEIDNSNDGMNQISTELFILLKKRDTLNPEELHNTLTRLMEQSNTLRTNVEKNLRPKLIIAKSNPDQDLHSAMSRCYFAIDRLQKLWHNWIPFMKFNQEDHLPIMADNKRDLLPDNDMTNLYGNITTSITNETNLPSSASSESFHSKAQPVEHFMNDVSREAKNIYPESAPKESENQANNSDANEKVRSLDTNINKSNGKVSQTDDGLLEQGQSSSNKVSDKIRQSLKPPRWGDMDEGEEEPNWTKNPFTGEDWSPEEIERLTKFRNEDVAQRQKAAQPNHLTSKNDSENESLRPNSRRWGDMDEVEEEPEPDWTKNPFTGEDWSPEEIERLTKYRNEDVAQRQKAAQSNHLTPRSMPTFERGLWNRGLNYNRDRGRMDYNNGRGHRGRMENGRGRNNMAYYGRLDYNRGTGRGRMSDNRGRGRMFNNRGHGRMN